MCDKTHKTFRAIGLKLDSFFFFHFSLFVFTNVLKVLTTYVLMY